MEENDILAVIEGLQSWHGKRIAQLQQILDHKDSNIAIADINIVAGSDIAKGLRIGVMLAIEYFGKLPINIEHKADMDGGDEYE